MVAGLAALPRLERLIIEFPSTTSHPGPDQIHPPSRTRTVLPALTSFHFQAAYEYQEDFISQIDSPRLNWIFIVYLDRPVGLSSCTTLQVHPSLIKPRVKTHSGVHWLLFRLPDRLHLVSSNKLPRLGSVPCCDKHLTQNIRLDIFRHRPGAQPISLQCHPSQARGQFRGIFSISGCRRC
jgi:hypothetical protein